MDTYTQLQNALSPLKVEQNKDISPYFTLKTVANAEFFVQVTTQDEFISVVKAANTLNLPLLIIGGGSNVAVTQNPIHGIVLRNIYAQKEVLSETDTTCDLRITGGYAISRVVKETVEAGLSGFEYHKGLPGSVGGAIFMNSKWMHPETYCGDTLIEATLLTREGEVKKVSNEYFRFAYDYSILQDTHELFLEGVFRFTKMDPAVLKSRSEEAGEYRARTQPVGVATSGCFFRNITKEEQAQNNLPYTSAGYLIDKAGLKNKRVGGFVVSDKHANFIVNLGGGTVKDLQTLVSEIKSTVKQTFGIDLHEEVVTV